MAILGGIKKWWNAFRNPIVQEQDLTYGQTTVLSGSGPSRTPIRVFGERSIVTSIYNTLSVDAAGLIIKHCKVDDQKRYLSDVNSSFNACLTLEPNIDQAPRAFRQDIIFTLFDRGVAAIVPVDAAAKPDDDGFTDIFTLRVGEILEWFPQHVRVNLYNEEKGMREEITLPKRAVAIVENPLYAIMNEPNSTLQRLIRKLSLLDVVDEQSGSGKLDLIIQLPYTVKSEARKQQAVQRREDIEFQLRGSQYGIAYTDATEKITQLNRASDNNLMAQVEYLTKMLYNQLGLTEGVMNGTADEEAMTTYYHRSIVPLVQAIVEAMHRTFIGTAGVARNEAVMWFRNPFEFTSVENLAEVADKFIRNTVVTANELRGFMGIPPASDPKADELRNPNMPEPEPQPESPQPVTLERNRQNGSRLQRVGD